jgi:predicted  nucleic acid-binding Zn-ribbon protein
VTPTDRLAELHDLDLLLEESRSLGALDRLGLALDGRAALERARDRLTEAADRRGLSSYERARLRYGRGMAAVRDRVCQGCFMLLPTAAVPAPASVQVCESCSRVLYWR